MQADGKPDLETMVERASLRLHVEHYMPSSDPRLVLVMVHGFSAHCGLYRHVGRALANRGIAVTQFDSRGHGRSGGQRGHVDNFADYLDDLEAIIAWARARNPRVPWALMGHSMGGAVSAALVLDGGRNIRPKCLVLAAPWLKLKMKVSAPKANVVAKVVPTLTWPSGLVAEDVSRNPIVRAGFHDDPLVHHVASAGWFMAMLHAQAKIRASASNLRYPTSAGWRGSYRGQRGEPGFCHCRGLVGRGSPLPGTLPRAFPGARGRHRGGGHRHLAARFRRTHIAERPDRIFIDQAACVDFSLPTSSLSGPRASRA
jgi:alpha-beta hydrolase superfamily lysophospholipase